MSRRQWLRRSSVRRAVTTISPRVYRREESASLAIAGESIDSAMLALSRHFLVLKFSFMNPTSLLIIVWKILNWNCILNTYVSRSASILSRNIATQPVLAVNTAVNVDFLACYIRGFVRT